MSASTTTKMQLPDDDRRKALYLAFFEVCAKMATVTGDRDATIVLFMVGLAGMDGNCVNVSSVADSLGMSRKKAKRHLDQLVEQGKVRSIQTDGDGWATYCRCTDGSMQAYATEWIDSIYEVFHRHLGTAP